MTASPAPDSKPGISPAGKLHAWATLARLEYAGLSTVAVTGALTAQAGIIPWSSVAVLFVLNALVVMWGFIHNDLADEAFDRIARPREQRPLLSGAISRKEGWCGALGCCVVAVMLHLAWFGTGGALAMLLASMIFAGLYNRLGKHLLGSDLIYGLSAMSVVFIGFLAVRDSTAEPLGTAILTWCFATSVLANHIFLNAIEGGLKDIHFDRKAGAKTFAVATGVRVEGDCLIIPTGFRAGAWLLRAAALASCWLPPLLGIVRFTWIHWVLLAGVSLIAVRLTWKLTSMKTLERKLILRLAFRQEGSSGALFVIVLAAHAHWPMIVFISAVPMVLCPLANWLLNRRVIETPPTI